MKVIPAKMRHLDAISEIVSQLDMPQYKLSDKRNVRSYICGDSYFVAVSNGNILGALALDKDADTYEIYALAVKEKKKGVGKALIDFAVKKCRKEGIKKLWTMSSAHYGAAGFYRAMGFDEELLMKRHYHGQDCYYFGKLVE